MEIIKKIKKFFKQGKKLESVQKKLQIQELEAWLDEKNEEIKKNLEGKTKNLESELFLLLEKLEEKIKILEKVNINERKEHERIKQIAELGKKDYILAVKKLKENLKEKGPIPFISDEINKFANYSAKSHFRATHLIGKEIEDLASTITSIRKLEVDFLKNNNEMIKNKSIIKSIIEKNEERKGNEERKNRIRVEIEEIKKIIESYEKKFKEIEQEIKEVKESSEANRREDITNKIKYKEESLKGIESTIRTILDKRILEKYLHLKQDKKNSRNVQKYIENPIKAVLLDNELKILRILDDIKQKIENNAITLKNPKKVIEKISIDEDLLSEHKNNLIRTKKEIENLEEQLYSFKLKTPELQDEKIRIKNKIEENKNLIEILSKKNEKIQNKINEILLEINSRLIDQNIKFIT